MINKDTFNQNNKLFCLLDQLLGITLARVTREIAGTHTEIAEMRTESGICHVVCEIHGANLASHENIYSVEREGEINV